MPNGEVTHDIYTIDLALNDEQAQKAVQRTSSMFSRMFQSVGRTIERMTKQKVAKSYTQWVKGLDSTIAEYSTLQKEIVEVGGAIQKLQTAVAGAKGDEKKAIQESIAGYEKQLDVIKKKQNLVRHGKKEVGGKEVVVDAKAASQVYRDEMPSIFAEAAGKAAKQLRQTKIDALTSFAKYDFKAAGTDVGDGFKDILGSLGSRDLAGMGKGLAKAMGAGMKGIGAGMTRYGMKKAADPSAGGVSKAIGKMATGFGSLIGIVSKLAPLFSMIGGAIAAVVKIFIDADAAAKEFNKEILASASTTEILYDNGMDAGKAYDEMADTMQQIRTAAMGLSQTWNNMDWGIGKKQFSEVLGAFTAEGVSLRQIRKDADSAKQSVEAFSTEMVKVAVTYSRNFGVSLNEVSTFQGQMVAELGMGLSTVEQSFNMIARASSESGIASNKFFAMIRNVSADMSLFNLRMEDAVMTLKMLGKAMSPRNAEKFMQTITQHYKNMGLTERIGAVLKAGGAGKVGGMLKTGLKTRITGMSEDIAAKIGNKEAAKELREEMAKGPKATARFIAKHQDKLTGVQREAIYDAQRMGAKLQRGGLVDVASALKDASPAETMGMFDAIAQNFFKKPIDQLADVQILAFSNLAGVSDEQIDQLIKARNAISQMKEDLAYKIESGGKLTEEQTKMMENMDLQGTAAEKAAKIRGMKDTEMWAKLTDIQRKEMMGTATTQDYAKKQTDQLDSVTDKLERIIDALLNWVYEALTGMWKTVTGIFEWLPGFSSTRDLQAAEDKAAQAIMQSGNKELIEQFKKQGRKDATGLLAKQQKKEQAVEKQAEADLRGLDMVAAVEELTEAQGHLAWAEEEGLDTEPFKQAVEEAQKKVGGSDAAALAQQMSNMTTGFGGVQEPLSFLAGGTGAASFEDPALRGTMQRMLEKEKAPGALVEPTAEPSKDPAELLKQAQTGTGYYEDASTSIPGDPGAPGATVGLGTDFSKMLEPTTENTGVTAGLSAEIASNTAAPLSKHTAWFKFPEDFLKGIYAKTIKDSVLDALRIALFEFWMYQDEDRGDAATWLKGGGDPKSYGSEYVRKVTEGAEVGSGAGDVGAVVKDAFGAAVSWWNEATGGGKAPKQAAGGLVTGISGGMAIIRPATGEGLTSIGRGETIIPAGARAGGAGGAVRVELSLKGDLARIIEAKASDVVYESKRRERFTG